MSFSVIVRLDSTFYTHPLSLMLPKFREANLNPNIAAAREGEYSAPPQSWVKNLDEIEADKLCKEVSSLQPGFHIFIHSDVQQATVREFNGQKEFCFTQADRVYLTVIGFFEKTREPDSLPSDNYLLSRLVKRKLTIPLPAAREGVVRVVTVSSPYDPHQRQPGGKKPARTKNSSCSRVIIQQGEEVTPIEPPPMWEPYKTTQKYSFPRRSVSTTTPERVEHLKHIYTRLCQSGFFHILSDLTPYQVDQAAAVPIPAAEPAHLLQPFHHLLDPEAASEAAEMDLEEQESGT